MIDVGIVGVGTYLPEKTMKAAEIAGLTNGVWSEDAVINKLGIKQRYLPGPPSQNNPNLLVTTDWFGFIFWL